MQATRRGVTLTIERGRDSVRRWERSFRPPVERAVVVSALRRGCITLCAETVSTPPLGIVGGRCVDGVEDECVCRIAAGLPASTADALIRALGCDGDWPRLVLPWNSAAEGTDPEPAEV